MFNFLSSLYDRGTLSLFAIIIIYRGRMNISV